MSWRDWKNCNMISQCLPSFCNLLLLEYCFVASGRFGCLHVWISAPTARRYFCLKNQRRWWGDSVTMGKQWMMLGGLRCPIWQHIPLSDHPSSWFKWELAAEAFCPTCPDVFVIKWAVRPFSAHSLSGHWAWTRCGRLPCSDKPGMLLV